MRLQVLYGLPHRPWHAEYPGNTQIGRFIKHISILKCEACAKDGSYIAGEVGATPRASTDGHLVPVSIISSVLALLRLFWAGGAKRI